MNQKVFAASKAPVVSKIWSKLEVLCFLCIAEVRNNALFVNSIASRSNSSSSTTYTTRSGLGWYKSAPKTIGLRCFTGIFLCVRPLSYTLLYCTSDRVTAPTPLMLVIQPNLSRRFIPDEVSVLRFVIFICSETEEPSDGLSQIAARILATSFAYVS